MIIVLKPITSPPSLLTSLVVKAPIIEIKLANIKYPVLILLFISFLSSPC